MAQSENQEQNQEQNDVVFPEIVANACGLDVHKETIVATVAGRDIETQTRTFGATTRALTELLEWLLSLGITHIAMESTGVYWKPVMNILEEGHFSILVVNARHIKYVPGGRGLSYMEKLQLTRKQINGMLDTVEEILTLSNRYGYVGTEIPFCLMDKPDKYKRLSIGTQCAAAKNFFVIDPSGNIRACNHSPHVVGNILNADPIEDNSYWSDFATSNYKPSSCRSCGAMTICDCGCREVAHILCNSYKIEDPCINS